MNRRSFLAAGAASLAAVAGSSIAASAATQQSSQPSVHPDKLNPPGIRARGANRFGGGTPSTNRRVLRCIVCN